MNDCSQEGDPVMDENQHALQQFVQHEATYWSHLKATPYCKAIMQFATTGTPLSLKHWLRFMMQSPSALTLAELARLFDEEDTMSVAASIITPPKHQRMELLRLILFSILHPSSRVRVQWDSYILLVLSTVLCITPFVICFDLGDVASDQLSFLGAEKKADELLKERKCSMKRL
jgi:hypothetical protein